MKSPCDVEIANTAPEDETTDCVATHQLMAYLPASLNVITPVALL
jgi:hypothetical protein